MRFAASLLLVVVGGGIDRSSVDGFAPSPALPAVTVLRSSNGGGWDGDRSGPPGPPPPPPRPERQSVDLDSDMYRSGPPPPQQQQAAPVRERQSFDIADVASMSGLVRDIESESFGGADRKGGYLAGAPGRAGRQLGGAYEGDKTSSSLSTAVGGSSSSSSLGSVVGGSRDWRGGDYPISPSRSYGGGGESQAPTGGGGGKWWESQAERGTSKVEGTSRRTFSTPLDSSRSTVVLDTDGRPLDTTVEVWDGPNNTPTTMKVKSEDGRLRPFRALIPTPDRMGRTNSVDVRNVGPMEFPLRAGVDRGAGGAVAGVASGDGARASAGADVGASPEVADVPKEWRRVQGAGALRTFTIDPYALLSTRL